MNVSLKSCLFMVFLLVTTACFGDLSNKTVAYETVDSYTGKTRVVLRHLSDEMHGYPLFERETDEEYIERRVARFFKDTNWIMVDRDTIPDIIFHDAFKIFGGRVVVDLEWLKVMRMNKIRGIRKAILDKSDIALLRAIEREDVNEMQRLKAWRQALRDIPQTFDMSIYSTPELVLLHAIPEELHLTYDEFSQAHGVNYLEDLPKQTHGPKDCGNWLGSWF